jgi:hypothetical protein
MKASRELLEDQLFGYEQKLAGIKCYVNELKDKTTKHGTAKEHFHEDLIEAEHNLKFYQGEIEELKRELGSPTKPKETCPAVDSVLPRTKKQGIGSLVISSVSFLAGAVLGSKMRSRRDDGPDRK